MKPSLKAVLLSGLLFPGTGYFVLGRTLRGIVSVSLAATSLLYLVRIAIAQAQLLMSRIMDGSVSPDAIGIMNEVSVFSAAMNTQKVTIASFVLMACWIVSVLDAYRIGQKEDLKRASQVPVKHAPAATVEVKPRDVIAHVTNESVASWKVRRAQAHELPRLLQLYQHLHAHDAALPDADVIAPTWTTMLSNPAMHVLVAAEGEVLVSSATLIIIPNLTRGARPYALIENVVTDRAWRRRGVATQVLRTAQQIAWDAGCYKVMLMTGSKKEETLRFYRNAGFIDGDKTAFIARPA